MKLALKRFEVENFRGFKGRYVFNLEAGQYNFNQAVVYNGLVKNALVYGANGSGKTSLGLAMFEVVSHLTDNTPLPSHMITPFLNVSTGLGKASFLFAFKYGQGELVYSYEKGATRNLHKETLIVNNRRLVEWEYSDNGLHFVDASLMGTLNLRLKDNKLSVIKYIAKNTPTGQAQEIADLVGFVEKMLWFRNLDDRSYAGIKPGEANIVETLREHNALPELEKFLEDHKIHYKLDFREKNGASEIVVVFDNKEDVSLGQVVSSGTQTLILYFAWSVMAFNKASLVFIDEFDAFLHFDSAIKIIRNLSEHTSFQSIVTTHNVSLLKNELTRPDCCFVMGSTKIASFTANFDRKIREAHNLEKMYVNGLFAET